MVIMQTLYYTLIAVLGSCTLGASAVQLDVTNRTGTARASVECVRQIDSCRCETAGGGRVDLSPLAKSGGQFAFDKRLGPKGDFFYSFNPCNGAPCDGSTDAAVCQKSTNGIYQYLVGTQTSAKFKTDPTFGLVLSFTARSGDNLEREGRVQLVCDTTGSGVSLFTALDDGTGARPIVYKMSLLSGHCCEATSPPGPAGGVGLSGGDILLIVFFTLLFAYVSAGLVINLLVLKRSGVEAVPNVTFWVALPGLVRDGAVFTFSTAKGAISRKQGNYESI